MQQQMSNRMTACVWREKKNMVLLLLGRPSGKVDGAQCGLKRAEMTSTYLTKIEKLSTEVWTETGALGDTIKGERC
jgi:hypothetical protein